MRRLAIETSHPDCPGGALARALRRGGDRAAARRQQPAEAAAPARLSRPRRPRAARRGADRRRARSRCPPALAGRPDRPRGQSVRDRGLRARRLLRPGRGEPGGRAAAAAAARRDASSTQRRRPGGKGLALLAFEPAIRLVSADVVAGAALRRSPRTRAGSAGRLAMVAADAAAPPWATRLRPRGARRSLLRNRHPAQASRAQVALERGRARAPRRRRPSACSRRCADAVAPGGLLALHHLLARAGGERGRWPRAFSPRGRSSPVDPAERRPGGRATRAAPGRWRLPTGEATTTASPSTSSAGRGEGSLRESRGSPY